MDIKVMLVGHIAWRHHGVSAIGQPYLGMRHLTKAGPAVLPNVTTRFTSHSSDLRQASETQCQPSIQLVMIGQ